MLLKRELMAGAGDGSKESREGISLSVQWLRLHLPMQGVGVQSLVEELRSHMPYGQQNKT